MELKTIRGYSPEEATKLMIEPLGSSAYKKHPTKSYLTTISPAYTRERLTKVFGLMGLGWGLDWNPEHVMQYESSTSKGKTRYHFAFVKADFWYALECDGKVAHYHIPVTGENDNDNLGDAMAGARTSAIGQGAKELLFQLHVYKDIPAPPKKTPQPAPKAEQRPVNPAPQPAPTQTRTPDEVARTLNAAAEGKTNIANDKQLKFVRASLSKLVDGNNASAKSVLAFLFGVDSSTELTTGEASAVIDWAGAKKENNYTALDTSIKEAAAIIRQVNIDAGQQPLFDGDDDDHTEDAFSIY